MCNPELSAPMFQSTGHDVQLLYIPLAYQDSLDQGSYAQEDHQEKPIIIEIPKVYFLCTNVICMLE